MQIGLPSNWCPFRRSGSTRGCRLSTAWPTDCAADLTQLATDHFEGIDIAQLWTLMEQNTPVTAEEVARLNAIATQCNVP